jgi:hypothetical protein
MLGGSGQLSSHTLLTYLILTSCVRGRSEDAPDRITIGKSLIAYLESESKRESVDFSGAIFQAGSTEEQTAFKYAVGGWRGGEGRRVELGALVNVVETEDTFKLSRICKSHNLISLRISIY